MSGSAEDIPGLMICSGRLLLCIVPSADADPLHSVKWHPKQPDTLAVASETKMYLLDLADAARTFRGEPLPQGELNRISQVFSVPSVSHFISCSSAMSSPFFVTAPGRV